MCNHLYSLEAHANLDTEALGLTGGLDRQIPAMSECMHVCRHVGETYTVSKKRHNIEEEAASSYMHQRLNQDHFAYLCVLKYAAFSSCSFFRSYFVRR